VSTKPGLLVKRLQLVQEAHELDGWTDYVGLETPEPVHRNVAKPENQNSKQNSPRKLQSRPATALESTEVLLEL
jgi:hypothetical protein